jgi:hypothetical protein
MRKHQHAGLVVAAVLLSASALAQKRQQFTAQLNAGSSISIINSNGSIMVLPARTPGALSISALPHSTKVEVNFQKGSNRLLAQSHVLQEGTSEETRVDYEVLVPAGSNIVLRTSRGPIDVDGVMGDIACDGESAIVKIRNGGDGQVHVRTVDGPITLANVKKAHVEIVTVGGDISLQSVTGLSVSVSTAKGAINYQGDFAGGGLYAFSTHSGDIHITMPAATSVEMTAQSVKGSVDDAFSLKPIEHPAFGITHGKAFAGTSNGGTSSVKLRSFSGKIRLSKQ